MSGKGRALAAAAALALAGYVAAVLVTGAGSAASGPELDASVGPGFTISLTQGGTPVTTLAPGAYTIDVSDMASIHDFHLQGPGVDEATSIPGIDTETWDVTFTDGQYSFFCDAHQSSMNGAFSVSAPATTSTTSSTSTATSTASPPSTSTTTATTPPATTTTAPTTTVPPPATSTTAPVATTTTPTTTTTPPSTKARPVESIRVEVLGRGARRMVVVRVDLAKAGTVRVRLLRRSRRVASMSKRVGVRPAKLTLRVPASAPAGRYSVEVVARARRIVRTVSMRG